MYETACPAAALDAGASANPSQLTLDPVPCYWPGKAMKDYGSKWSPATYVGNPKAAFAFCLAQC